MSREIKFRAWDLKIKYMYYTDATSPQEGGYLAEECKKISNFNFDEFGDIDGISLSYGGYGSGREFNEFVYTENRIKIMQYTGLKDKNGTEIYEGDILRYPLNPKYCICYVVFSKGRFRVKHINNRHDWSKEVKAISRYVKWEVIGNIYEHHHLLESQNERQ